MELNREQMLRGYPAMPECVRLRLEDTLSQIRRDAVREPPRRHARRLSFATVMLIALLAAAIGIAAGMRLGIFDFMARTFGQSGVLPEARELVQTDLASLDLPHTEVRVREAVYDGGSLRVVYSIRQKDAAAPLAEADLYDEGSGFRQALTADRVRTQCDWFYIDGMEYVMTNGTAFDQICSGENGELLCYMDIQLSPEGIVPQGDFVVGLPLVSVEGARRTLDFAVQASVLTAEHPFVSGHASVVTAEVAAVTPVRVRISIHIEMDADASMRQYDEVCGDWSDAALVDAQGRELAALEELLPANVEEGRSIDYSYTFLPTDAAEVYLAPMVADKDDNWLADMSRALKVK